VKNNKLVRPFVVISLCLSLIACVPGNRNNSASSVKFQQYFVEGEGLYKTYCVNCHQSDGSGLRRLYPPLDRSDFMQNNLNEVICLIKNGREGELWVNGVMYNQPMKGIPSLTELEVAELATYIYNAWSNQQGLVELEEASSALSSCPDK
jgi:cytochrome c551